MLLRKTEAQKTVQMMGTDFVFASAQSDQNNADAGRVMRPQAYKDISADGRKNLRSLFAFGKRSGELDAYRQAHMTPAGTPGVVNLGILDNLGRPQPFVSFNWNGRAIHTDARGMVKYVEKDYFQNAISLENERVKYVTQMISLVVGQPAESVIALFGVDFYKALAGWDRTGNEINYGKAEEAYIFNLYKAYLDMAGINGTVAERKAYVFMRYANAEASPEVMCNFGDNDPEWSRAFNKLALLIEYHPSAIIFDEGTLNPMESSGRMHGDGGHNNAGPMDAVDQFQANATANIPSYSGVAGGQYTKTIPKPEAKA